MEQLKYHEYYMNKENDVYIFSGKDKTCKYVKKIKQFDIINNNISTICFDSTQIHNIQTINTRIVTTILENIVRQQKTIVQYHQLCYNIIVNQKKKIIFYDYYDNYNYGLLTMWIRDLYLDLTNNKLLTSDDYYKNKDKNIKYTYRCVIITQNNKYTIQQMIDHFEKIGFQNIIVNVKNTVKNVYKNDFVEYLNKHNIIKCIKYSYEIFSQQYYLLHFLMWCCISIL